MYAKLSQTAEILKNTIISDDRKAILSTLIDFIQAKVNDGKAINLNFICTHNSRRSHLSQIWAQFASSSYNIKDVNCYSGGTEETALFPKVAETLSEQGFSINIISEGKNPVYAIKFSGNSNPMIGFSKKYNHPFNPESDFAAIMTCSQADGDCPYIPGAEKRIPVTFEDPKISDNSTKQTEVYYNRSLQIGAEMFYVFSQIK
jgi:arsenate reductase